MREALGNRIELAYELFVGDVRHGAQADTIHGTLPHHIFSTPGTIEGLFSVKRSFNA